MRRLVVAVVALTVIAIAGVRFTERSHNATTPTAPVAGSSGDGEAADGCLPGCGVHFFIWLGGAGYIVVAAAGFIAVLVVLVGLMGFPLAMVLNRRRRRDDGVEWEFDDERRGF